MGYAAEGKVVCGVEGSCAGMGCSYRNHYQWMGEECQDGDAGLPLDCTPTPVPTPRPTHAPTAVPTSKPTLTPTVSKVPTSAPTSAPTARWWRVPAFDCAAHPNPLQVVRRTDDAGVKRFFVVELMETGAYADVYEISPWVNKNYAVSATAMYRDPATGAHQVFVSRSNKLCAVSPSDTDCYATKLRGTNPNVGAFIGDTYYYAHGSFDERYERERQAATLEGPIDEGKVSWRVSVLAHRLFGG